MQVGTGATDSGDITIDAGGTLAVAGTFAETAGLVVVDGALSAAAIALSGGVLQGSGTLGGAVVDGGTALIEATGTLAVDGSYQQAASATLEEVVPGAFGFGAMTVTGTATLGGTLAVALQNGAVLAAGETLSVVTAGGGVNGAFAELVYNGATAQGTSSLAIGNGLFLNQVYGADTMSLVVSATAAAPPVLTTPGTVVANLGSAAPIGGLSVTVAAVGSVSVTLADATGDLAATGAAGATVAGDNTTQLTLSGTPDAVNAELASVTDTPQGSALSDTITLRAIDAALQSSSASIAVSINQPPTIALPQPAFELPGVRGALGGIGVTDPDAVAAGETLTAVITDSTGTLSATASGAGSVTGSGSTQLTLTGGLGDLNAELATLAFLGSATDTVQVTVSDGRGGVASASLPVAVSAAPSLTTPGGTIDEFNGVSQPVSGVQLVPAAGAPADVVYAVTLKAGAGGLSAVPASGAQVSGSGTATLVLSGTAAALNATLATLTYAAPGSGTADSLAVSTPDGQGGAVQQVQAIALAAPPPPGITASGAVAAPGILTPIDGLSVAAGNGASAATVMTVVLSNSVGRLGLQTQPGGAAVTGLDTTGLTLVGTALQINADLAQLTFVAPANDANATLDTIAVKATEFGVSTSATLIVSDTPGGNETPPGLLLYTGSAVASEQSTVGAVGTSDGYLRTLSTGIPPSGPAQLAIGAYDGNPTTINVSFSQQPFAVAQGFSTIGGAPVEGAPALSMSYLLTAADQNPAPGDQITYVIKSADGNGRQLPDERLTLRIGKGAGGTATPFPQTKTTNGNPPRYIITPSGNSFPASVIPKSHGGTQTTHLRQVSPWLFSGSAGQGGGGGNGGGNGGGGNGGGGNDDGDVHLTTFDGLYYNFQAVGEFVLARSTAPGDTFEVQIRTQPYFNGAAASVTTEVGAQVGTHRVTFDLFRSDTVWVDGAPATLSLATPLDLGSGVVRELSPTSWQIRYDSGETVVVTKETTFLNVNLRLTPRAAPGSVQGLLGTDSGRLANEFTLPNGTVLPQPLSYTDLYTTWADAWRVTQATSLLDYGPGQTTQTYTDLNFPSDSVPVSLFPAQVVAQAQSLVAAAGITDPGAAQAAVEDYLLTGDTSFIAAAASITQPTAAIAPEPTPPIVTGGVGIAANVASVVQTAAGTTDVVFTVYRTGDTTGSEVVDYAVQAPGSQYVGIGDFAGAILPSGQVTIAAGDSATALTIPLSGTIGNVPQAILQVGITAADSAVPVIAPVADVTVGNSQPVPGVDAVPVFENTGAAGTLTQSGSAFVLDLGTFDLDSLPPSLSVALANVAPAAGDTLSGIFTASPAAGLGLVSGYGPVTNLGPGGFVTLGLALDTSSAGTFTETITFAAREANPSGYLASIGTYTLTIEATVAPAIDASATPPTVDFGAVHAGAKPTQALSILNTGTGPISVDVAGQSGDALGTGTIAALAGGATDGSSVSVGLATGTAGAQSGDVALGVQTPGAIGQVEALLLAPVAIQASGSFTNAASLLADQQVPAVGAPDNGAGVVSWTDPATTFTYDLGSVQPLSAALASVDVTGTYVVATSTDGVTFTPLFTILPEHGLSGLTTVSSLANSPYHDPNIVFAPTDARYVRLQASGGAGTYAAGELDLFTATPTVAVSGTVFNLATADVSAVADYLHVNDAGTVTLPVANGAPAGADSENLIASIVAAPGLTIAGGASTGEIAAGTTAATPLQFDVSTAQPGVIDSAVTLAAISDGGTGPGSIDGLGTTALGTVVVPVVVQVDRYAAPTIAATTVGTIDGSGAAQTLDVGVFERNAGPVIVGLSVENVAPAPADTLSGTLAASGPMTAAGFGAIGSLAGGQADGAPTLTIDGTSDGTFVETVVLTPTDSNPGGFSEALAAQTLTVIGTIADLPLPTISAASSLSVFAATPSLLGPITISDPNTLTQPVTVVVSDATGLLTAYSNAGATVANDGGGTLTIVGDLGNVNDALASLAYQNDTPGSDTLVVTVTDQHRVSNSATLAVTVAPVPPTAAIFNAPTTDTVLLGTQSALGGYSITDPAAVASGETLTLTLMANIGTLSVTGNSGALISGAGTGTLSITGTVPQINADLADAADISTPLGLLNLLGSLTGNEILKSQSGEDLVVAAGGPEGKFFQLGVITASFQISRLLSLIPGNPPPDYAAYLHDLAEIMMPFPAIVTPQGTTYRLEGQGEYVLAATTLSGDSFDVQVRMQPVPGSTVSSEITQIAAGVGSDRVTFGVGRDGLIYVDGTAAAISPTAPILLSGGEVTEVSATTYKVSWNTGEVLTVLNGGSYLAASVVGGPNDPPGSIVGLLNNSGTAGAEFILPNGSTLASPASEQDVLGTFMNAWRVPQSFSLFDYAPGQETATFTNTAFPTGVISLSDLPVEVVNATSAMVAAAGVTDPGLQQLLEYDLIVSGGNPAVLANDLAIIGNATQGVTLAAAPVTPGTVPVVAGVFANVASIEATGSTTTPVVFDAYLAGTLSQAATITWSALAPGAGFVTAAGYGGILPTGTVVIAAGQTLGQFTIDLPSNALGTLATDGVEVQIGTTGGLGLIDGTAQATVDQPIAGPSPVPQIVDLTNLGTFTQQGSTYLLDLGNIQYGEPLPPIQFAIENLGSTGSDSLGGTLSATTVEGFSVSGDSLPSAIGSGLEYTGLNVAVDYAKFGPNEETITYTPTDTNGTGFNKTLPTETITVRDTIVPPTMVYSYAWGDVHIVTYNGTHYDFQAAGEFTLAKSLLPNDSFDIQLRLVPLGTSSVSVIQQVAVSLGADRVTFDDTRSPYVEVNAAVTSLSATDPVLSLPGGTITQITQNVYRVNWNTGEEATISDNYPFMSVADGIPLAAPNMVHGLQGEDAGAANDFQLSDGTVLPQPVAASTLYGAFADSWRVTQATSLFDYLPGQTTATFTDRNFPADAVTTANLPANLVQQATSLAKAAGIVDPTLQQDAALDYIATGSMNALAGAAAVQQQGAVVTPAPITQDLTATPAALVSAVVPSVVEAAGAPTPVVFDVTLTGTLAQAATIDYTVVDGGAGFLGATVFSGTLPSGTLAIAAGGTIGAFTIDVPQNALGASPNGTLEVQISAADVPVFTPEADTILVNPAKTAGPPAVPQIVELSHFGTLIAQGGSYVLDLGTLVQGEAVPALQLGIVNAATAPADDLGGSFSAPTGSGFLVTGNNLPAAIPAGAQYDGLYVAPGTANTGTFAEHLTFTPTTQNDSGYSQALTPIPIVIEDTVGGAAAATINTPGTIVFANTRVGGTDSRALSITNSATAPAANLDVTTTTYGSATVSGAITGLAPGATDTKSIDVGLPTGVGGALAGIVQLNPVSDAGGGNTVALQPDPQVDLFGSVYRTAMPVAMPVNLIERVGGPDSVDLTVANAATADGYSENLVAAINATSAGLGIGTAGPTGEIAAGASDQSLSLTFDSSRAGTITGTATLTATSDGGTGPGSIDGLGTAALPDVVVPVQITLDAPAQAALEELGATPSLISGPTLDLGTFVQGSAVDLALGVVNTASGPADQLAGSFVTGGSAAYSFTGFDAFGSIAAGGTYTGLGVGLDTSQDGLFTATITLAADSVLPGGGAPPVALGDTVLTLIANVVPCFVAGTRIRTPGGQVPVETLEAGDLVCVEGGGVRPVVWAGEKRLDLRAHPDPYRVQPIRIRRHAFGRNRPSRDLFLSPDHAVYLDGVLIPVRRLVDGDRVARMRRRHVHYVHIELDRHDIVLAEGLPAESYLDTGDRHSFTTIGFAADALRGYAARVWEAEGRADLVLAGPALERVRARLRRRGTSGRAAGP
ncbi:Hint domain-containing protein [Acidisphaera rubrifaciens]|uniref:Hint domain-containing protein n=1 Tax=Acidisphaera rubrifaciens TaxID=50715 RepID=UPI0019D6B837|nr:Hint domain-containing protein [Acidisphaera rubrifaciens]